MIGDKRVRPACPYCQSLRIKRRLYVPSPGAAVFLLVGGALALAGGLSKMRRGAPSMLWQGPVIMGALVAFVGAMGFVLKRYACVECGRTFNPPSAAAPAPLQAVCPKCGERLKGVTAEWTGEVAVCRKCDTKFTIGDEGTLRKP